MLSSRARRSAIALATLICLSSVSPVVAQNTLWQGYMDAGTKAYNAGNYVDAERLFAESLKAAEAAGDKGERLDRSLVNLGNVYKEQGKYAQAEDLMRRAIGNIERGSKQQQAMMPLALNNLAATHETQGHYLEAMQLYQQALDMAEKRFGVGSPQSLLQLANLTSLNINAGDYVAAANTIQKAMPAFKRANSQKTLEFAVFLFHSAHLAQERGQFETAEKLYSEALKVGEIAFGKQHRYYGAGLMALGALYEKEGRYSDSERVLKESLEIVEKATSSDNPAVSPVLNELATTYLREGKYDEAQPLVTRAMQISEKAFGPEHPLIAESSDVQAQLKQQLGDYREAETLFKKSLAIRERAFTTKTHPNIRRSLKNLGLLYLDEGKYDQAEEYLNKALTVGDQKTFGQHPEMAEITAALARTYSKQKRYDLAEQNFKKALADTQKIYGKESTQYADIIRELGITYEAQGQNQSAQIAYSAMLAIDERAAGAVSAKVAGDLEALARVYTAMGDTANAAQANARAEQIKAKLPGARFIREAEVASATPLAAPIQSGATPTTTTAATAGGTFDARPVADKWALVVGISNFKDPSINLKYATKDAIDFKNFLVNGAHFAPDHVKLLVDGDAKRENIIGQLGDQWLGRVANKDDLVVIYVSSHGSSAEERAGGVNFLVAHDTRKDSLLATGIPMQWLTNIVKDQVHSDRVVMILDVCHSAAANGGSKGLLRTNGVDVDGMTLGHGQAVLCSSLADQLSWESKNYQNSVFTRRLIEALKAKGDQTKLSDAYSYLRDAVESEVLRDRGQLQTPVLNKKLWVGGDAVLSVVPTKPRAGL